MRVALFRSGLAMRGSMVQVFGFLVVTAWSLPALACTPLTCSPGEFLPRDGGAIPVNAPALGWRVPVDLLSSAGLPDVQLLRLDVQEQVDVEIRAAGRDDVVQIVPAELVVGGRYRLRSLASSCVTPSVEFAVGDAAELPMELGAPVLAEVANEEIRVWTSSGTCYAPLPVNRLSIELERPAAADAWADLLIYRTLVDGEPWMPSLEQPVADDSALVFCDCSARSSAQIDRGIQERGLPEGAHMLRFEAELLGAGRVSSSDLEIELRCAPATAEALPPRAAAAGCSVLGGHAGGGPAVVVSLGVICLLLRRRPRS
jgi:hypothetical protein